ncbi:amidohydrolase family protein [Pararhodobacter zhoushanensis]|uniref:Amidohydrolase n=1 Tax=Pararhodobacter zhoushanensis TaxID=2479545 RepID=A0ABT3GZC3_9RHOB|nr:amidohydrolase family protein [Pararhodobacter zhoushanensis]MCW1932883.1 amidohydrolase [Pararhodobacter zhoushanensis]
MSDTLTKDLTGATPAARTKQPVVDCDIHPAYRSPDEMASYLPLRWQRHVADFGLHSPSPLIGALPYPRLAHGMRQDSYPPVGGPPASDLEFLQEQLLDPLNITHGILQPLSGGHGVLNHALGEALCAGTNDWQVERWMDRDPRLKGSIAVMQEDAPAALREIEARAKDKRFVQISVTPRTAEPAGHRRYWPIYEAAEALGLPISLHSAAFGARANTGAGWTSFYIEEHFAFSHAAQHTLVSLIFSGVFDAFPKLKVVLVEGGFAWLPPTVWRMEREFDRYRGEVPDLKRRPAEYVRDHIWLTTQPVEEPTRSSQLSDLIDWVGVDRLLFSTDYPHWDFDHPDFAFRVPLPPEDRAKLMHDNAVSVFGLT